MHRIPARTLGVLVIGALALLAGGARQADAADKPARPNVVIVLVDDMGWSDLGCYGSEIPTPNIDALAAGGLRYTQFYNTARCSTTRASLLTGLYPHQAGMGYLDGLIRPNSTGTTGRLSERCVTMAEVLREAGYFTAMAGKWHLGQQNGTPPWKRGFHRALNSPYGEIYFPTGSQTREPARTVYLDGRPIPRESPELGRDWYSTDLWVEFGLKFIDEARAEQKPSFFYLAHGAPHFPLMAPAETVAQHRGKYLEGWDALRARRHARQLEMGLVDAAWAPAPRPPATPAWADVSAEERDRFDAIMAVYAAMIDRIDRSIGTLVEGLRARGELDNTLILLLSDNGGNAESGPRGVARGTPIGGPDSTVFLGMNWAWLTNTPFFRFKHFTHEGGISTPLVAHWPRGIPAARNGKLEPQPGHLVDLMATVVDVCGATYPAEYAGHPILPCEGVSLRPSFSGEPLGRTEPIYWEHEGNRALRDGKWKLVMKYRGPWELYDIEADRTERNNLAAKYPQRVAAMAARWEAWAARSFVDAWTGPARNDWGDEIKPAAPAGSADRAAAPPQTIPLWTSGQDGYHTYRIPALLVTPRDTVLAFCEGRKTSHRDHGDLDLVVKRSQDGGRTWTPQQIVHEEGGDAEITIGNPCPVVDAASGTVWLPFCRDNRRVLVTSSSDDGRTWTPPRDLSDAVTRPDWTWVATGPGIGIQLRRGPHAGRLVIPCDHRRKLPDGSQEHNSHMMFSDDGGRTWAIGAAIQTGGNECQVIERADGTLLVNARMQGDFRGYRGIATSTDGGQTFTPLAVDRALPCPLCQGSLVRYAEPDASGPGLLLFSNPRPPAGTVDGPNRSRVDLTVRLSRDDGRTWPVARRLHAGPAAYSSLARLADGTILCLYEAGTERYHEGIRLARFAPEWLTAAAGDTAPRPAP